MATTEGVEVGTRSRSAVERLWWHDCSNPGRAGKAGRLMTTTTDQDDGDSEGHRAVESAWRGSFPVDCLDGTRGLRIRSSESRDAFDVSLYTAIDKR